MCLYRPNRELLAESMELVREIQDKNELQKVVESDLAVGKYVAPGEMSVEYYGYDDRIDWDVYVVLYDGYPAGWTNGPVD